MSISKSPAHGGSDAARGDIEAHARFSARSGTPGWCRAASFAAACAVAAMISGLVPGGRPAAALLGVPALVLSGLILLRIQRRGGPGRDLACAAVALGVLAGAGDDRLPRGLRDNPGHDVGEFARLGAADPARRSGAPEPVA